MTIKRRSLNKLGILTLSATMIAGGILPSVAGAQSPETQTITPLSYSIPVSNNLGNVSEVQGLAVGSVIEISDAELIETLRAQGHNIDEVLKENNINPYVRGAGTTKIVIKSDHIDVYLSKTTLQVAASLGAGVICVALSVIPVAGPAISTITSLVLGTLIGSISNGKVYRFKTYKQSGMIKSVMYLKSWSQ